MRPKRGDLVLWNGVLCVVAQDPVVSFHDWPTTVELSDGTEVLASALERRSACLVLSGEPVLPLTMWAPGTHVATRRA